MFSESKSILTDGIWLWTSDLSHYIEKHDLWLPEHFLFLIRKRNYQCPDVGLIDPMFLEWP